MASNIISILQQQGQVPRLVIDATFGCGGHSRKLLENFSECTVFAIDKDSESSKFALELESFFKCRFQFTKICFSELKRLDTKGSPDAVIFDLGTSIHQLCSPSRGFSFNGHDDLDMRLDPETNEMRAIDVINQFSQSKLQRIFSEYGEEKEAARIAREIVRARERKIITSGAELANIVGKVKGRRNGESHPATQTFQALRIYINDEISVLQKGLNSAIEILSSHGLLFGNSISSDRLVISFHSLEDKAVKSIVQSWIQKSLVTNLCKSQYPSADEISLNPPSRSAKLRVYRRC